MRKMATITAQSRLAGAIRPLTHDFESPPATISTILLSLLPTASIIAITEVAIRYSESGYSVIVIVLLGTILYTALASGLVSGFLSALLIVVYNFYLVSERTGSSLFSVDTLQSGSVIGIVFPALALIVGRLKERNDALLAREQKARLRAEESAYQLRFMAESIPQKIFTTSPNGATDYFNPQWEEYMGPSDDSAQAYTWADIVHPDDRIENAEAWKHSLKSGKPFQFEHRLRRTTGEYRWHITRARALRDEKGKIVRWVGSSTDIEDVRKAKKLEADTARLIRQRTQLMELNTAKDEFISLASHQLRTPATGVKQYINIVLDGYGGDIPQQAKTFLEKANDSNERQLSVINDLLQVAQVDAGKVVLRKEQVNVHDLITSVAQEQGAKFASRDQRIRLDETKKNITVMADPAKLRMVLENMIDNASKYSPEGSVVTMRTLSSRGKVRIVISDEGVGIDKKDIEKVFQKFMRVDNPLSKAVGGSGLGLYWVRKVIDLHGGDITVTSALGKGTSFTISLPT